MTQIIAIWAQDKAGVIGRDGAIPWHVPADLRFFRQITHGRSVIMGRRTWDSLPPQHRPLPGRDNIVVTRDPFWWEEGATPAATVEDAIGMARGDYAFVIGGAQVYEQALPHVDRVIVTELDLAIEDGDTYAPVLGSEWEQIISTVTRESNDIGYRWVQYHRKAE